MNDNVYRVEMENDTEYKSVYVKAHSYGAAALKVKKKFPGYEINTISLEGKFVD